MSYILIKCIKAFMGDRTFTLKKKDDITTMFFINDNELKVSMTLTPNMSFKEFKQTFARYNKLENSVCPICYESVPASFGCSNCKNWICLKCYFDMLEHNRGVYKCPMCRYEEGKEILDNDKLNNFLDEMLFEIKKQADLHRAVMK